MTKDVLGSAGEHGSRIDGEVDRYLVDGYLPTIGIECHVQLNTATKLSALLTMTPGRRSQIVRSA